MLRFCRVFNADNNSVLLGSHYVTLDALHSVSKQCLQCTCWRKNTFITHKSSELHSDMSVCLIWMYVGIQYCKLLLNI